MYFMPLLLGIVLVAVICTAREIVKGWRQMPSALPLFPSNSIKARQTPMARKRAIRYVSMMECETLLHASGDVVLFAVKQAGDRKPVPFHGMQAVAVTPGQLASELRWLPSTSCVVLCGEEKLCSSVLGSLDDIPGTPPIYVLKGAATCGEVA